MMIDGALREDQDRWLIGDQLRTCPRSTVCR